MRIITATSSEYQLYKYVKHGNLSRMCGIGPSASGSCLRVWSLSAQASWQQNGRSRRLFLLLSSRLFSVYSPGFARRHDGARLPRSFHTLFLSAPWKAQADSRGDDALGGSWTDYHEIKWEHPVPKHHQRHARRPLGKAWAGTSTLSSAGNSGVGAM